VRGGAGRDAQVILGLVDGGADRQALAREDRAVEAAVGRDVDQAQVGRHLDAHLEKDDIAFDELGRSESAGELGVSIVLEREDTRGGRARRTHSTTAPSRRQKTLVGRTLAIDDIVRVVL